MVDFDDTASTTGATTGSDANAPVKPSDPADSAPTVADKIAARTGFDDSAPLGDPDAPQGSGPETNTNDPANRPAPQGEIRKSDAASGK